MVLLSGCKTLPPVHMDSLDRGTPSVKVAGADGPLSERQSAAVMGQLARNADTTDDLSRHIALVQRSTHIPLVLGNRVTLLQDDGAAYSAMATAIGDAKDNINMETYIFEDDKVGHRFARLLLAKQAEGVQVNLIYDSVGTLDTPRSFFERLKHSGMRVLEFNPVNPLHVKKAWRLNHRDHRKLLIVDGRIAFTGSVNIGDTFSSGPMLQSKTVTRWPGQASNWRDTQVRIEGPVVGEFQKIFLATWKGQNGPPLPHRRYFPPLSPQGSEAVLAVNGRADAPRNPVYVALISAIESARTYVHLTNAYFVPDPQLVAVLKKAAWRGVDVRLILPSHTDSWLAISAGRSHYEDLLEAGVKIYERKDAVVHSKTAVIDGVWSCVGSTNLDWRSFVHNDELNALILGRAFAQRTEAWFAADQANSRRILRDAWRRRSPLSRLQEWLARLWAYWL